MEIKLHLSAGAKMSVIKRINDFFRKAVKKDVEQITSNIVLSERQKIIFDMFTLKDRILILLQIICVYVKW